MDHYHSLPNEDSDRSVVKQCGTPHCVPAEFSTSCHPTLPRFDSWFFMLPPPNLGLQLSSSPAALQLEPLQEKQFVQTSTISWTFRHAVPPPSFPAESLSFNGKPVSKCVPLSRPTRVLSVIPVTGAPILHGKATTPTHHHSLDFHRKAPTPSPNQLTYRPPGQKTGLDEYIGFQLSAFRFRTRHFISSNHVRVSTFYHIDAVILSSTELKDGH